MSRKDDDRPDEQQMDGQIVDAVINRAEKPLLDPSRRRNAVQNKARVLLDREVLNNLVIAVQTDNALATEVFFEEALRRMR